MSIQLHPMCCLPCMGARAGSLGFTSKLCWVLEYLQNILEGVAATSQSVLCDQNQLLLLGLLFWVLFQFYRFPTMPAFIPVPRVATWPLPGPDNRWLVAATPCQDGNTEGKFNCVRHEGDEQGGTRLPSSAGMWDHGRPAAPAEAFGMMRFGFKLGCVC